MPRGANFSREELDSFLDIVEEILPISATQWEHIAEMHNSRHPDKGRSVDSLKRKFKELHIKQIPTGDPLGKPSSICSMVLTKMKSMPMGLVMRRVRGMPLRGGDESREENGEESSSSSEEDDIQNSYEGDDFKIRL